jgi:ubiquinone/menaquinone biosynthesis C-methylase UbiE
MGLYQRHVLPWIIDKTMRQDMFRPYRRRALAQASGRVLEIGMGSGVNAAYYGPDAALIVGVEPAPELVARARRAMGTRALRIVEGSAESLPLASDSVDTVVTTWTLCSIPDVAAALREARRVLRRDGRLIFVEHGRADDPRVQRWQDRLTPVWKRLAGGCHLNRPIADLVREAGFAIEQLDTGYLEGPRPLTFTYEGRARPR